VEDAALSVNRAQEGFVGEAEVIRRLADVESLALFRPFPDLETVEVLCGTSRRTVSWPAGEDGGLGRGASRDPGLFPSVELSGCTLDFICVLGWERESRRFADDCLLIPSGEIAGIARVEGEWLMLEVQPGSVAHRRLDRFRLALASLGSTVQSMLLRPFPS